MVTSKSLLKASPLCTGEGRALARMPLLLLTVSPNPSREHIEPTLED
jgi:hypothetical protein